MSHNKEIWIIDDHHLFSAGMKQMLSTIASDSYLIRAFSNPEKAAPEKEDTQIALIIIDFYIPGSDTLYWIKQFFELYPETPIVVISSSINPTDKTHCINAGATAYYPKHAPPEVALEHLTHYIFGGENTETTGPELSITQHKLTNRQVDILIYLARGNSNKKVAKILEISPETVKTHIAAIYKAISCENRDEAVEWARNNGLV